MTERSITVTVEAIGPMRWDHVKAVGDPRWLEPHWFAQVVDGEGHRYFVTPGMCYRNGTALCEKMLGRRGRLDLIGLTPRGFSLPILFGRDGEGNLIR